MNSSKDSLIQCSQNLNKALNYMQQLPVALSCNKKLSSSLNPSMINDVTSMPKLANNVNSGPNLSKEPVIPEQTDDANIHRPITKHIKKRKSDDSNLTGNLSQPPLLNLGLNHDPASKNDIDMVDNPAETMAYIESQAFASQTPFPIQFKTAQTQQFYINLRTLYAKYFLIVYHINEFSKRNNAKIPTIKLLFPSLSLPVPDLITFGDIDKLLNCQNEMSLYASNFLKSILQTKMTIARANFLQYLDVVKASTDINTAELLCNKAIVEGKDLFEFIYPTTPLLVPSEQDNTMNDSFVTDSTIVQVNHIESDLTSNNISSHHSSQIELTQNRNAPVNIEDNSTLLPLNDPLINPTIPITPPTNVVDKLAMHVSSFIAVTEKALTTLITNTDQSFKTLNEKIDNQDIPNSSYKKYASTFSRIPLTHNEILLLEKGGSFKLPINHVTFYPAMFKALYSFNHSLNLAFNNLMSQQSPLNLLNNLDQTIYKKYKPLLYKTLDCFPTSFQQLMNSPALPGIKKLFTGLLDSLIIVQPKLQFSNLSTAEQAGLRSLSNKPDIVISHIDKGTNFIIMNKQDYIQEGLNHFNNVNKYLLLPNFDPVTNLLRDMKLNKEIMSQLLTNKHISVSMFKKATIPVLNYSSPYLLFKTHKPLNLHKFVEFLLCKLLRLLPAKVWSSSFITDFIPELNSKFPDNSNIFFSSLDVVEMYPNLNHNIVATSIAEFYNTNINWLKTFFVPLPIKLPPPEFIKFALFTILQNNIISFHGSYYKPIKGIQMGASCSVTIGLADLYMHIHIENRLLLHHWNIFFYCRFIDDILLVLHRNVNIQSLMNHFTYLTNLPFTSTPISKTINFLDFTITIINGKFVSYIYKKPSSQTQYLHFESHNPLMQKKNIFCNQLNKIIRYCSDSNTHYPLFIKLKQEFQSRKYPSSLLNAWFNSYTNSQTIDSHTPTLKKSFG
ncbi:unnamed protein product, partial [Rotaria magnacalcarata]